MSALDRDAAREVLRFVLPDGDAMERALDALEACVRPVPAQTIDRNDLFAVLNEARRTNRSATWIVEHVLALLRPVEGVVLTSDDVRQLRDWYTRLPIGVTAQDADLAKRLQLST